jgi:hypothetical protein
MFDGIEDVSSAPSGGPVSSLEFRRIRDLPRRVWDDAKDLEELVAGLTDMFKVPDGEWTLKVTQAAALRDLHDFGGLFGPIVVGGGKTLITLLAPELMKAKRPVLLVPAALRDQTLGKVLPEMKKHWRLHPNLRIIGYSELSQAKNANLLDRIKPDMIVADECHMLKNPKSGRTRRVSRYMNENPHTVFVAVSGTVANHSIMHYWHIAQWALKPDNAPVPKGFNEAKEWANALDERVPDADRTGPGVLLNLAPADPDIRPPHPQSPTTRARRGYRRRLVETPGVLATSEDELGVSLQILGLRKPQIPTEVQKVMRQVYALWETPDGEVIMEAVQLWRIMRELCSGFYYRWNPAPPREWLRARKEWGKYVRETLKHNRRKLDTPLQVWNETERHGGVRQFETWKALKDTFKPNPEAVWMDDYLVQRAVRWLKDPGICWVEHQTMGDAISRAAGVPYFGAGDSRILDAKGPVVASIAAHGTGKNLQQWDRNLVVCPPTAGGTWEQLTGRTHRMGQESDTVTFEVNVHHVVFEDAMKQAFADARFLEDSLGNRQRLLYCDTDMREWQRANG